MKSAKRFLLIYFAVYVVISVAINALYGPPGMSKAYLQEYKADHDRYLSTSKSDGYKLFLENPALNPPATARVAANYEFADAYQQREPFLREMQRRDRYEMLFDVLRAVMVLVLVVRFAATPLAGYLNSQVGRVRERLDAAAESRRTALERESAATAQLASLDTERQRLIDEARARVQFEQERMNETAAQALAMLAQEQEDRVRNESLLARRALKKELVEEALGLVRRGYEASRTAESEAALVSRFVEQMEQVR